MKFEVVYERDIIVQYFPYNQINHVESRYKLDM